MRRLEVDTLPWFVWTLPGVPSGSTLGRVQLLGTLTVTVPSTNSLVEMYVKVMLFPAVPSTTVWGATEIWPGGFTDPEATPSAAKGIPAPINTTNEALRSAVRPRCTENPPPRSQVH
jgi:hypothetical protein